jgi:hypothetical protein
MHALVAMVLGLAAAQFCAAGLVTLALVLFRTRPSA